MEKRTWELAFRRGNSSAFILHFLFENSSWDAGLHDVRTKAQRTQEMRVSLDAIRKVLALATLEGRKVFAAQCTSASQMCWDTVHNRCTSKLCLQLVELIEFFCEYRS